MNRFKKTTVILMAICLMVSLSACSGGKDKYESTQGFEFHFYPEEYEKEYGEVSKTLLLEADTDYQLQIDAACDSGTMEICVMNNNEEAKTYTVKTDTPCSELLVIPANSTNGVTITISIEPDTKGAVIGDLLVPAK